MYNHEHKGVYGAASHPPPMSPRISFSHDFAESSQQHAMTRHGRSSRSEAPPSSDFEFLPAPNCSMMSGADELFSQGRLLPYKDNNNSPRMTTLRDELLAGEVDDDGVVSLRPPKGSSGASKWKGLLGLRKTHNGSKKSDKMADGPTMERSVGAAAAAAAQGKTYPSFCFDEAHVSPTTSQQGNEGSSFRDGGF